MRAPAATKGAGSNGVGMFEKGVRQSIDGSNQMDVDYRPPYKNVFG